MPYDAEQRKQRYLEKRDELIAYQLQYYRENKEKCQQTNTEWYRKFREEHGDEYRERQRAYYRKKHPKRPTPIRYSKPPKPPKLTKAEKKIRKKNKDATDENIDILVDEYLEQRQTNADIDTDAYGMSHLGEGWYDGNYDGAEYEEQDYAQED